MSVRGATPKRKRVVKPPEERRHELIDAAVRVFARRGVADATIADITVEARVGKGTFYLHFASKEELLAAIRSAFVDEIVAHASPFFERVGQEDWWELTDAFVASWVDFALDRADLVRLVMQQAFTPDTEDVLVECERKLRLMMALAIQAGVEAGAFRVSDPELTASMLHHALEGSLQGALAFGETLDRDRFLAAARDLVHRALAP
jgi:AcrR family transcriptional regulator